MPTRLVNSENCPKLVQNSQFLFYRENIEKTHFGEKVGSKPKCHYQNDRGNRAVISWFWLKTHFVMVFTIVFCICEPAGPAGRPAGGPAAGGPAARRPGKMRPAAGQARVFVFVVVCKIGF